VFSDGTLYFEAVGLHHTGNFTCHDKVKPGVKQIHMLNVNCKFDYVYMTILLLGDVTSDYCQT